MFKKTRSRLFLTTTLAISFSSPYALSDTANVSKATRLLSELSPEKRSVFLSSLKDEQTLQQLRELIDRMDNSEVNSLLRQHSPHEVSNENASPLASSPKLELSGRSERMGPVASARTNRATPKSQNSGVGDKDIATTTALQLPKLNLARGAGDLGVFTASKELDEKLGMKQENRIGGSKWAYRWEAIRPTSRIFFDTGNDDEGEIDLFKDGKASVQLQFLTMGVERAIFGDSAILYPNVGIGMSSVSDSETDSELAVALSAGLSMEFVVQKKQRVGVEVGYMHGFTPEEGLADSDDGALFVGLTFGKGLFSNGD